MAKSVKKFFAKHIWLVMLFAGFLIFIPARLSEPSLRKSESKQMIALIPHLDIAGQTRQRFLQKIKLQINPSDVIVLSTNHFGSSEANIIFDSSTWDIKQGSVKGGQHNEFSNLYNSHELVVSDHGIRNVVPDIYNVFPDSGFTSFLIKNSSSEAEVRLLIDNINSFCQIKNRSCLILGSVDMSHYNPSSLAEIHDGFTLNALRHLNIEKLKKAETDSPEVLTILTELAKIQGYSGFDLFERSDTGIVGNNNEMETTSWIIGNFSSTPNEISDSSYLIFAGDIMLDRSVNHIFKDQGFERIFDNFSSRVFWGTDASIANLEGPINDGPVIDDVSSNNLVFNFPLDSVKGLIHAKLTGFSLANNHTLNDSSKGLTRTRKILTENNLLNFGSPKGLDDNSIVRFPGTKVSLIGVNLLEQYDHNKLIDTISAEKAKGQYVVAFLHWGNEYQTQHSASQDREAHWMIDSGVDMIIGSHPHVVQDSEVYQGKLIVYSLGNFIFDQFFSDETQEGCLVAIELSEQKVKAVFIPTIEKKVKPELAKSHIRTKILDRIVPSSGYLSRPKDDTIELTR